MNSKLDDMYLTRLIDDLQTEHTNLFNSLKSNSNNEKERNKLKEKQIEKRCRLLSDLMTKALSLKTILSQVK
jgi:hypothetical protein